MSDYDVPDEESQRLFAIVWGRPATEVGKKLGNSDVAVSKRCCRLQAPVATRLLGADCNRLYAKAPTVTA